MTTGVKTVLHLPRKERNEIDLLLRSGALSEKTTLKLISLKELADPEVSVADSGLSRQTRHNWIKRYSDPTKRRALLEKARMECEFLTNSLQAQNEFCRTPLSEIAEDTKISSSDLKKIAGHLNVEIPRKSAFNMNLPDFVNYTIRKCDKGAEGSKTLRPNIIDLGGIFHFGGHTIVAFAIYGSTATRAHFNKLRIEASRDTRNPNWTDVATSDVLTAQMFQILHDLSDSQLLSITSSIEKVLSEWINDLKKEFPEKKWEIHYFVPPILTKYFKACSVTSCDKPTKFAERVARLAVDRIATPGIFPTIREWLIRMINIIKAVKGFELILGTGRDEPIVLKGSGKESFISMRRILVANYYWAAQGNVFYLEQPTSNVIKSRHTTLYKVCELKPRYVTIAEKKSDPDIKYSDITIIAEIFPGQHVLLDAGLGMDPKYLEKAVRKRIGSSDALSRFYYDDGIDPPPYSRGLIGNTGHFSFSKDDQSPKDSKGKEGSSCRLMPRRFLFPDATPRLQEIPSVQEKSINSPDETNLEDSLIFDGRFLLNGIAQAFKENYYSDVISTAGSWQEISLLEPEAEYVPDWCPPIGRQYVSVGGDEISTIDGWLQGLPKADGAEREAIVNDNWRASIYHRAVALGQLWTHRPSFTCDFSSEGKLELWTTNFRNLFIHLDADFLMSGLASNFRQIAESETVAWQENVATRLTYLQRRNKDDKHNYTEPEIRKLENSLRYGRKQSDEVIENIFSKAQDRMMAYHSKIVRMAMETCARQVLAGTPTSPA